MTVPEALNRSGPRKLLAIDGGGIRGVIAIEILRKIEALLRAQTARPRLVLADWFDYVGGTSTGAIIAACVALGMDIETVADFYRTDGPKMFQKTSWARQLWYRFSDLPLRTELQARFGADTTLGSSTLRTLLLLVLRNASTDSPWPVSNNPAALYNDIAREDCNLHLPLWQLVRASTAAPVFFAPERIQLGSTKFMFVDGGITAYNNPSFALFLMATLAPYRLCWQTGTDNLLLVSVGTGHAPASITSTRTPSVFENALHLPLALMSASNVQQDVLCRAFGKCVAGDAIDSELGDLTDVAALPPASVTGTLPKLFTYARYNPELTSAGLARLGLNQLEPKALSRLDAVSAIGDLQEVGRIASHAVHPKHFAGFLTT